MQTTCATTSAPQGSALAATWSRPPFPACVRFFVVRVSQAWRLSTPSVVTWRSSSSSIVHCPCGPPWPWCWNPRADSHRQDGHSVRRPVAGRSGHRHRCLGPVGHLERHRIELHPQEPTEAPAGPYGQGLKQLCSHSTQGRLRRQKEVLRGLAFTAYRQTGPWWPAVGAPLERGVRPHPPLGLEIDCTRIHSCCAVWSLWWRRGVADHYFQTPATNARISTGARASGEALRTAKSVRSNPPPKSTTTLRYSPFASIS
jgi:hypothetical protein